MLLRITPTITLHYCHRIVSQLATIKKIRYILPGYKKTTFFQIRHFGLKVYCRLLQFFFSLGANEVLYYSRYCLVSKLTDAKTLFGFIVSMLNDYFKMNCLFCSFLREIEIHINLTDP